MHHSVSKRFIIGSCFFFGLFALFTLYIKLDLFVQHDFDLLVKLQNKLPQTIYPFFSMVVVLGSFIPSSILVVLLMKFRNRYENLATITLFGSMHVVEIIGKFFLDHKGPPYRFFKQNPALSFPLEYSISHSYPSGHALRAFFIATLIVSLVIRKKNIDARYKISAILFSFTTALTIAIGKVALGHHWVSDTVGGLLLGIGCGCIIASLKKQHMEQRA